MLGFTVVRASPGCSTMSGGYGGLRWTLVQRRKADPGSKALPVFEGGCCGMVTLVLVLPLF